MRDLMDVFLVLTEQLSDINSVYIANKEAEDINYKIRYFTIILE